MAIEINGKMVKNQKDTISERLKEKRGRKSASNALIQRTNILCPSNFYKLKVMGRLVGNDSGKKIESILCSLAIYFSAICFLAYSSSLIYYYTNKSKKENNSELWTNYFGEINSNFKVGDKMLTEFISPSSPPKKSSGFLGPKKSSERFLRNPRQTTHFSVWYKSEGFGDFQNNIR